MWDCANGASLTPWVVCQEDSNSHGRPDHRGSCSCSSAHDHLRPGSVSVDRPPARGVGARWRVEVDVKGSTITTSSFAATDPAARRGVRIPFFLSDFRRSSGPSQSGETLWVGDRPGSRRVTAMDGGLSGRAPASVCPPAALQSRNAARTIVPGAGRRRRPRIGPAPTIPVVGRSIPQRVGPGFRPVRWVGRASHCSRSARTASSVRVTTPNRSNRRDR